MKKVIFLITMLAFMFASSCTLQEGNIGETQDSVIKVEVYEKNGRQYANFGSYPQTHVNDANLISELNELTAVNSRGYYEYHGHEYAKVATKPYNYGESYTYSTGKIIEYDVIEWFKVEPISWMILSTTNNNYQVLSEYILDYSQFYNNDTNRIIDEQTIYPNNYKYSDIREFLNNKFLNSAFKTAEQSLIVVSEVDNSENTTIYPQKKYTCENTFDKIYLLSYREIVNYSLDFFTDEDKKAKVTDYAKAMGVWSDQEIAYYNVGEWWLRSPYNNDSIFVSNVDFSGSVDNFSSRIHVSSDARGVRPSMVICAQSE